MTDVWVCATCHSLNRRQRNVLLLQVRGQQVEAATGASAPSRHLLALQGNGIRMRDRSSLLRCSIASGFIIVVAVLKPRRPGPEPRRCCASCGMRSRRSWARASCSTRRSSCVGARLPSRPASPSRSAASSALVAFAARPSRFTATAPALGGGTPGATLMKASTPIPLIPVVNLIRSRR